MQKAKTAWLTSLLVFMAALEIQGLMPILQSWKELENTAGDYRESINDNKCDALQYEYPNSFVRAFRT